MTHPCESCGFPVETGRYCPHCVDAEGALQDFATRFAAMASWRQREYGEGQAEAERATLAHMAAMPAWRDHPRVRAAGR
jgi:hypothetical protein